MTAISLDMDFDAGSAISLSSVVKIVSQSSRSANKKDYKLLDQASNFHFDAERTTSPSTHVAVENHASLIEDAARSSREFQRLSLEKTIVKFFQVDFVEGEEAVGTLTASATEALLFLSKLPTSIPLPGISLAEDGVITFEWNGNSKMAAATFEGDEEYGYAYLVGGRFVPGAQSARIGGDMPEDLICYLKA
ncbi:hypothetical protein Q3O97_11440 [Ralstonia pseudosolanacearum]|uniref:hypothetical protein n=1 Tax=Ralstonia pseudosolanacearum TaxID=1310165 RepID=UPI0026FE6B13|nr:hypothetical protein [Ralstonia pseudosolanacearum]MDO3616464.1 hypothetical protein [Ralstonia pseudosolanacearum]